MIGSPKFSALCVFALSAIAFADDFELPVLPETKPVQQALPQDSAGQEQTNDESDYGAPVNFTPIEATSVSETHNASANLPSGVIAKKIPENLNRPLKVGVYIGVKELYLKLEGETIHMTPSGNMVKFQGKENSVTLENKEIYGEGNCISIAPTAKELASACYPGHFYVSASKGLINAVNVVDVEEYLRGVVPYEIGKLDSSRFSALESQAIAARTYAYKHFGSRESMGFDVYADTKDQVYMGLRSATPLTDSAVKSTAGIVMTYNGEFIIAYYHSTCGGITETLATWNRADLPYLKSVPDRRPNGKPWCDESSYTKWERRFADKEIVKLFKANIVEAKATFSSANGKDFKKIKSIKIKDKLKSERIMTLRVETDKGHFDVLTDRTRWLFKKAGTILPSSFFTVKKEGKEWVLTGTGFGHGVGMCQMGVRARAQAGQSHQEILSHYYQGITLEKFDR